MTSVNVTTTKNTVTVNGETRVVTVKTQGPQGPAFSDGDKGDVTVSSNGTAISINNSAVTSAKIADGAIVNADINASAAIALSKLATGALPTAITVTSANISDLSIVDADISGSAAISLSKLATGALPTAITVTSANISDLSIVNADINASAAIAGTKISPDFGSQNIVTTGTGATGALGVTGDITVSGTVDGRDVAADGTKLDGIETGATADQTASEIKTAYESNSDTNAFTDTLLSKLNGIESNATADQTKSDIDALGIAASTAATLANARTIAGTSFDGSANIDISYTNLTNKLSVGDGGLTQNNFTDALKTKLDGVETGATADQTASEIVALIADQTIAPSTIDMEDNEKIKLGTGDDLEIYHDGSNSIIKNTTNDLTLQTTGDDLLLKASDNIALYVQGTENAINCIGNGAVDLFFNNSKKFATTSTGVTVTGNIAVTGTVDGRDVATDGTKLDGIEASATADQTAAEIKTLLDSNGIVNSNVDASAAIAGTKISPNFGSQNITTSGEIEITGSTTVLKFTENDNNPDFGFLGNGGLLRVQDLTNTSNIMIFGPNNVQCVKNLDLDNGLDVSGNITVTGTVDGVDIATRDTLFGGLTSSSGVLTNGVTATTQSASDNSTKVATTAYADTAVANLVDSAPGTLNTLNELAAALGDDPNFATTVTNSIATKLPLAGGTLTGNLTISRANPRIIFTDTDNNPDYLIDVNAGHFLIYDSTNSANRLLINSDGHIDLLGNVDITNGLDVTGNITVSGTVDGRDVATDGTKLDGIEASATADQTASEIVSLLSDQDITTTGNFGAASVNITDNSPSLIFTDSANDSDFRIRVQSGVLKLRDDTNSANRLEINSSGIVTIPGNTDFGAGIDVTGNITVTGTVDGRDLATDGTKLDGIASNAIANIVEDTTPQLGGDLDTNSFEILLDDDHKIKFGSSNEFEIYHDSSSAYGIIRNVGQGTIIRSAIFNVKNAGGTKDMIIANTNGDVELYYDNSKKFETTSTGATISGNLQFNDNNKAVFGSGTDLLIYHDGSNSVIRSGGTGQLQIESSNNTNIVMGNAALSETIFKGIVNGAVELYYDNSKKLETTSTGVKVQNTSANALLLFQKDSDALGYLESQTSKIVFGSSNDHPVTITQNSGTALNIDTSKNIQIPNDNARLQIGASQDLELFHNGTNSFILSNSHPLILESDSLILRSDANEKYFEGTSNGAVELYYDNSKKFETISTGVKIAGNIRVGNGSNLDIKNDNGSETLAKFINNAEVELYYDNSKKLETKSNGINVTGRLLATGSSGYGLIFNDDVKISLGNSNDLQIYHDGSNSYIEDAGTGSLILKTNHFVANAGAYSFMNAANSETLIYAVENGSVQLYHDNSKKFETWTSGARLPSDNNVLAIGAGDDLRFWHNATNSIIRNATGELQIQSNSLRLANYNATETYITATENGAVNLFYDDSKKFETTSSGVAVTGQLTIPDGSPTGNRIAIGDSQDLALYHNSSNSFLVDRGTGPLYIRGNNAVRIEKYVNDSAGEPMIIANADGAVELYYDNSKKFETTTNGVEVTGSIFLAGKIDMGDSSSTTTGRILLGTGDDLQIFHNGTDSVINNDTGDLYVQSDDQLILKGVGTIEMRKHAGDELMIKAIPDGAVELYYNNAKKVQTTNGGIHVTGSVACSGGSSNNLSLPDNGKAKFGTGDDLQIYHDGTHSYIANSTNNLYVNAPNFFHLGVSNGGEKYLTATENGAVELYYDNSKRFETTSTGVDISGTTDGVLNINTTDSRGSFIRLKQSGNTKVWVGSSEGFGVGDQDDAALMALDNIHFMAGQSQRVTITGTGLAQLFGGGSSAPWGASFKAADSNNSTRCFFEGINGQANRTFSIMSEQGKLRVSGGGVAGTSTGSQLVYLASTTATSWTGGSDIRLKENITEIPNVLDKIKNYRCARFNFIGDDASDIQNIKFGFIAQDWLTDFPEVISKSTQDADDPTDTTEYYGMQYTETIPVLLKAIQELTARLEALEGA